MEDFGLNDNEESLHREVVGDDLVKGYPVHAETGHPIVIDPLISGQHLLLIQPRQLWSDTDLQTPSVCTLTRS